MLHFIIDRNAQGISPSCANGRARILSVDEEADLVAASSVVACAIGDIQGIADSVASGRKFLVEVSADTNICDTGVGIVGRT